VGGAAEKPLPHFSWTGCYLGGHVGGAWGLSGFSNSNFTPDFVPDFLIGLGTHTSGFMGGGQVGCNYQIGALVIGVEGDVSGTTLKGSSGPPRAITSRTDLMTDVTGRLGYAVGPWLVYGKGGAAWSDNSYSLTTSTGAPWTWSGIRSGWTAGGGIEHAFGQTWSAKVEYQYYNFDASGTLTNRAGVVTTGSYVQYAHAITVGLNWRFWTPTSATAMRR
jgi:outer membrane immunogenic protein